LTIEDELGTCELSAENPKEGEGLLERVLAPENLRVAYRRVRANKGAPGVDGITVDELAGQLRAEWPAIRERLLAGEYEPKEVRRKELPKPGGGVRVLGIPIVLDRFIEQALLQVLQPEWDATFSDQSYGFRPGRSAHAAVERAQGYYREGYRWVVDVDLEKFFDRVNHDKLMALVAERISDWRVKRLIRRYLKAGMSDAGGVTTREEGTPQGGPISPLLANLLLDRLDKELERRGHRFARYADDCNIYVRSQRAGARVMESVSRYLRVKLKLKVNEAKSAVARPRTRSFLGFSIGRAGSIQVSAKAEKRFKERIRQTTQRTRGRNIREVIAELRRYMLGWRAYFGLTTSVNRLRELTGWVQRRLRCYLWKQWGRRGYRELRRRGVSRDLAWNTCKSAHGPWRISRSPALSIALPTRYFVALGLPLLQEVR
jgi:RNA-directed DNA polymerase